MVQIQAALATPLGKVLPDTIRQVTPSLGPHSHSAIANLELIYLMQSPYSLRSRWMLNYNQLPYSGKSYTPIAEEPFLRLKTGKLDTSKRITVPILITGNSGTFFDSFDIAQWADANSQRGSDAHTLFPVDKIPEIHKWNDYSDSMAAYQRFSDLSESLTAGPAVKDRELAIVPPILLAIPGLKALLIKSTDTMVQKLLDKYADVSAANPLSKVSEGLRALRAALKEAGGKYVLGGDQLSYADITMASIVRSICPLHQPRQLAKEAKQLPLQLPQDLYDEVKDLIPWADGLFDKYYTTDFERSINLM